MGSLVPEQAGFRKGLGVVNNVFVARFLVERIIKQRYFKVYLCFIDFERTLDTIDRKLLWFKLQQLGIFKKILRVLQELSGNVELKVLMRNGLTSRGFKTSRRLRQGCQLSPLLFALFKNDLIRYMKRTDTHVSWVGNREVMALLYAYDLVLFSMFRVELRRGLCKLEDF